MWYLIAVNLGSYGQKIYSLFLLFWRWYCYAGATFETNVLALSKTHTKQCFFFVVFFDVTMKYYSATFLRNDLGGFFFPILSKIRLDLKACGITIQFLTTSNSETWLRQYQAKRCTEVKSADWLNMHTSDLVEETDYCVRAWKKCFHSHTSKAFAFMCQFLQKPFRFFVVFF